MTDTTQDLIRDEVINFIDSILDDPSYFTPLFLAQTLMQLSIHAQIEFINIIAVIMKEQKTDMSVNADVIKTKLTKDGKDFIHDLLTIVEN